MLKPVHPKDCVWVHFEVESISAVLHFLLNKGFKNKRPRNPDKLPTGIPRLGSSGGFIVKYSAESMEA